MNHSAPIAVATLFSLLPATGLPESTASAPVDANCNEPTTEALRVLRQLSAAMQYIPATFIFQLSTHASELCPDVKCLSGDVACGPMLLDPNLQLAHQNLAVERTPL